MTEKKQGVPVQEPVPAEEPAKAGDNNKIWHYNGKFPVVVDYLVFFGIFLLAQGLGTAVAWLAGCKWPDPELLASPDEAISTAEQIAAGHFNAVTYFVSMSVTLAGFLFYRRRRHGPTVVARFSRRGLNPVLLLWGVFFMLSTSVVLEPFLSLMPEVPNVYGRGAWAIVTVVVMAPLFEEVIFRGVLLESTRVRYGVVAAWLLSSAIFGIVHVHPTVVVNAFVMGLVLAFIYLRTDSLWSAIILHAINNGIAYLALIAGHGNSMLIDMVGSRTLYVLFYIAALAAIDPQLHEAAQIDGASRLQRILHINLPGILPTAIIMFILDVGQVMNMGFEKVFLMQNAQNTETSQVISTFVYEAGLINSDYGFSTAIGLFNNIINIVLLLTVNKIAKKISDTSLF